MGSPGSEFSGIRADSMKIAILGRTGRDFRRVAQQGVQYEYCRKRAWRGIRGYGGLQTYRPLIGQLYLTYSLGISPYKCL
jgi:hypothetical protein